MRLWHYKLLPYLDDFHIVAQWRELLAIKGAIDKNGTPNHRLVNKVLDYPLSEFKGYCVRVVQELDKRNIKYIHSKKLEIWNWHCDLFAKEDFIFRKGIYDKWHNNRYLIQCYYNLEEKYDCGIVSEKAWQNINKYMRETYQKLLLK